MSAASLGASVDAHLFKVPLGGKSLVFHTELMGMPRKSPLSLHCHAPVVGLFLKSTDGVQCGDPILIRFGAISKNQPHFQKTQICNNFLPFLRVIHCISMTAT